MDKQSEALQDLQRKWCKRLIPQKPERVKVVVLGDEVVLPLGLIYECRRIGVAKEITKVDYINQTAVVVWDEPNVAKLIAAYKNGDSK